MSLVEMSDRDAVHQRVCALKGQRGDLDYEQGRWLLAAHRLGLHAALGLGSFTEYAERFGGIEARQARERVRVAEALEELPDLAAALKAGELTWSAVRELTRVAVEDTEKEWLEAARGRTAREIERMVARQKKGGRPLDPPAADPPQRLAFEVTAPTWALVKEAREAMIVEAGASVGDDDFVATLARTYLAGRSAETGAESAPAPYSIAITVCDRCKTATQRAGADDVMIDAPTVERARCDAEELGRVDAVPPPKATRTIPPRVRRAVMRRHGGRCAVPGCRNHAFVEVHHTDRRADGGDHDPEKLLPLCSVHHPATHVGTLVIRGTYSEGFTFHHADGTEYGAQSASPGRARVLASVLEALVTMGFRQREAQRMIVRAAPQLGPDASFEEAVRAALRQADVPSGAAAVRESCAPYTGLVAEPPPEHGGRPRQGWVAAVAVVSTRPSRTRSPTPGRHGREERATPPTMRGGSLFASPTMKVMSSAVWSSELPSTISYGNTLSGQP